MEKRLFEFLRCRTLYEKQIEYNPANSSAWIEFANLERGLDDVGRARAIFALAIDQPSLDMPELVWKAFIDFEEDEGEYDRTRALYERLLDKTDHVKVWISYAQFELSMPDLEVEEDEGNEDEERPVPEASIVRAREVFNKAYKRLKELNQKDERVALLQAWMGFETEHGNEEEKEKVTALMPRRVKKRRKLDDESFEEYLDWVFPKDDEGTAKLGNLLAMAQKWNKTKETLATNTVS